MSPLVCSPAIHLLAVVVLYRTRPDLSVALQSLLQAATVLAQHADPPVDVTVLVWDNTPYEQTIEPLAAGVRYHADPSNPGLAAAYNAALGMASREGCEWLLTLDQDTELPPDWFARFAAHAATVPQDVAAILPRVVGAARVLSPYRLVARALPRWFGPDVTGVKAGVYALNSGAVLRVSAAQAVGGYDPSFPLDMSDTAMFHRLHVEGRRVLVVNDICLHHQLSLLNKGEQMSLDRYKASLHAEARFFEQHMSLLAQLERMLRLGGRAWRDRRDPALRPFYTASLQELKRRVLRTLQAPFRRFSSVK